MTKDRKVESAADWIKRTRDLKQQPERKIQKREQRYDSTNLKGIALAHSLNEFKQGETILTLRDTDVLDEDGEDMLENLNMADYDRDEERAERRKKASRPVYVCFLTPLISNITHTHISQIHGNRGRRGSEYA